MDLNNQQNSTVTISFIGETVKPSEEKTFIKREIAFNVSEEVNGNIYTRLMCMQAVGSTDKPQFDKTKLLDNFKIGDKVDVKFGISGSSKKNDKLTETPNNPECLTGFNNLTISDIKLHGVYGLVSPQTDNPVNYQPQPNYQPQAKTNHPQPSGQPPINPADGQPMIWNTRTGGWESLPF